MHLFYLDFAILCALLILVLLLRAVVRLKKEKLTIARREYWLIIAAALVGLGCMVLFAVSN